MKEESVSVHEIGKILWSIYSALLSLGLLVIFINDEANKEGVHSHGVYGHKDDGHHISEDTSKLNIKLNTMTW